MLKNIFKRGKKSTFFKFCALIFCFLIIGLSVGISQLFAADNSFKAGDSISVTTATLRVRALPTVNSAIIGFQSNKSKGTIVEGPKSADGYDWYKIDYVSGTDGWSAAKYLSLDKPVVLGISQSFKFKKGDKVGVTTQTLSVRSLPSTGSKLLGYQRLNATGIVLDGPKTANGFIWWKINYATGVDGWSVDKYLKLIAAAPVQITTPAVSATTTTSVSTSTTATTTASTTTSVSSGGSTGTSGTGTTSNTGSTGSTSSGGSGSSGGSSSSGSTGSSGSGSTVTPPVATTTAPVATTTAPVATTTAPVATTASSMLWGAYVGDGASDLSNFETLVGKSMNLYADFEGWDNSFPSALSSKVGQKGKTLIIFWEPSFGYDSIINGSKDEYIKSFAASAKAYGYPVILVPFDEMNLNEEAWGYGQNGNTAAKFKTAWQRIHDLFSGVTNVKFGVAYNNVSIPATSGNTFSDYYPGDDYVDYVGVDGFNFGNPWQTFGQVFDTAIDQLQCFHKPIYIFSTASTAGTQKSAWITEGLGAHIKSYSNIAGWVWFNQGGSPNWLVNSDTSSLSAFKAIIP